jgi:hypothetical protein
VGRGCAGRICAGRQAVYIMSMALGTGRQKVVIQISGGLGSPPDYNILHLAGAADDATAAQNAVNYLGTYYNAFKSWMPNGQIVTVGSQVLELSTGAPHDIAVTPVSVAGTDFSGFTPPQCAVVVSWKTHTATRKGRGRSFLGPIGRAGCTTNGTPLPAMVTAMQTAASTLINDLSVGGFPLVVLNAATPTAALEVVSAVVRGASFHTQRRRALA